MLLNIEVLNHVIVSPTAFYSFRAKGHIEELKYDNKYAYSFLFDKETKKKIALLEKEAEKKGIKTRNLEIAKELLREGMDKKTIMKITHISAQRLGRLEKEKTLGG